MLRTTFSLCLFLLSLTSIAQIDGDNIFATNQVITIQLEFASPNYYSELVALYQADENEYLPADLTLTDSTGTYEFNDVGVRFKGNSSYNHPGNKKSFKIDFNEFVTGQNYDGLKKLNFSNGFKDPSVIREKVFFDVCREAGVPAPRANFANVIMNGEPFGFYTVVEQIDDQFLDWRIGDDSGNLFKAGDNFGGGPGGGGQAADLFDYGSDQNSYSEKYELKTNEDVNDWTDLIEFIDFINNSSDTEFESDLPNRLELTEYLRSAALDMLFSNLDSYTGSARNYYIYHNATTGRWEWIKWDGNESFGSYTNNAGNMLTLATDYHNTTRPLLENIFSNTTLYNQYLTQICFLTENFFNPAYMDAKIDVIKNLVQEHVYADDNKMYTNNEFDNNIESNITTGGGPGGGTIYGLKTFVSSRFDFIANEIDCNLYTGINEKQELKYVVYPNPAKNWISINWEENENKKVSIYNCVGKQIINSKNLKSGQSIDIQQFPSGLYFIELYDSKGKANYQKFIKD